VRESCGCPPQRGLESRAAHPAVGRG
jgi:hypothetical protein